MGSDVRVSWQSFSSLYPLPLRIAVGQSARMMFAELQISLFMMVLLQPLASEVCLTELRPHSTHALQLTATAIACFWPLFG